LPESPLSAKFAGLKYLFARAQLPPAGVVCMVAMKRTILTIAAAALLVIPTFGADEKPAGDKPAGDKPAGERPNRGPGGPGGGRFGGTPEERVKRMTEQLGLTPEQAEKIKAIYEKSAAANKDIIAKGRDMTEEDRTKLRDSMKAVQDEVGAILTPEQKKKQEEARAQRGGPGGGRRGPGAPGAPGGAPVPPPPAK
jgi:Spy/CpxP family protein refolding chaperone